MPGVLSRDQTFSVTYITLPRVRDVTYVTWCMRVRVTGDHTWFIDFAVHIHK